jgi:hypothetical protein
MSGIDAMVKAEPISVWRVSQALRHLCHLGVARIAVEEGPEPTDVSSQASGLMESALIWLIC